MTKLSKMLNSKNGKMLFAVGIITIIGLSMLGGFTIGLLVFKEKPATFNPVIDGVWNESENWDVHIGNSWMYTEYVITDWNHMKATNYFYIHLDIESDLLYGLADLVSDGTNDTESEFFTMWIDGDNSLWYWISASQWNNDVADEYGNDMFCYIPETDVFNNTLWLTTEIPNTYEVFDTTMDESDVTIDFGFQTTTNAMFKHRIYEFSIEIDAIHEFTAETFNFAFIGYGTMMMYYTPYQAHLWSAPTFFGFDYIANGFIDEYNYYRCGTNSTGDIWNTPDEFFLEDYII